MKFLLTFIVTGFFLACNGDSSSKSDYAASPEASIESAVNLDASEYEAQQNSNDQIEQKLIKEAYLEFETQDLEKTHTNIMAFVKQHKGYVQDDGSNKYYDRISRQLTIRVPTKGFQPMMDALEKSVKHFDSKRISSKDVTEEFIDLEARLKAKRALEKRYMELLSKAKNVKEILEVERELSKIREAIEAKQGRLQYLQNKVSLSTINIVFYKTLATDGGFQHQ